MLRSWESGTAREKGDGGKPKEGKRAEAWSFVNTICRENPEIAGGNRMVQSTHGLAVVTL